MTHTQGVFPGFSPSGFKVLFCSFWVVGTLVSGFLVCGQHEHGEERRYGLFSLHTPVSFNLIIMPIHIYINDIEIMKTRVTSFVLLV